MASTEMSKPTKRECGYSRPSHHRVPGATANVRDGDAGLEPLQEARYGAEESWMRCSS